EARPKNPLPPRGGRFVARLRPPDDSAGTAEGDQERDRRRDQPVVSFTNRGREAPTHDAIDAHAARKVLQGPSWLSGGRSRGLSHGAYVRSADDGGAARCLAASGLRTFRWRSR